MSTTAPTAPAAEAASPQGAYDPVALTESLASAAEKGAKLISEFAARNAGKQAAVASDELGLGKAFMELAAKMLTNPVRLAEGQMNLWRDYMNLWQSSMLRMMGAPALPVAEPAKGDKRFKDASWHEHFMFDYVKQSYLITARWLHEQVANVEGLSDAAKKKVDFFTRQYIDALAPSNFALTNPEVLRETVASGGQNLVRGLNNLLDDIERGNGQLRISMTDTKAFELGVNIATTPGQVVFLYEGRNTFRVVPTDGRKHRDDVEPTWNGDAVGRWEGDTLVVDVTNIIDESWLGADGWFHSDALHVVERLAGDRDRHAGRLGEGGDQRHETVLLGLDEALPAQQRDAAAISTPPQRFR